jgi:hypothetical protein
MLLLTAKLKAMRKYILMMMLGAGVIAGASSCARCAECVGGKENGDVFCKSRGNIDEKNAWIEHCIEKGGEVDTRI